MAWRIWGTSGKGALYVGQAEHAKAWAWSNVDAIVNCAQYDFEYWLPDMTQHRWLHIQERSWFNGRGWYQRMRAILLFVILHLAAGRDALLHCWAGKHRSGVCSVFCWLLCFGGAVGKRLSSFISNGGRWMRPGISKRFKGWLGDTTWLHFWTSCGQKGFAKMC